MTRVQVLILAGLVIMVLVVFCAAAVLVRFVLLSPPSPAVAEQPQLTASPPSSDTPTLIFRSTATPSPTVPRSPTATNTRVVLDTATPTITPTPTETPIPTDTDTPTPARRSGGGSSSGPRPTLTPTSRYPIRILEGPVAYKTHNHFLVILAQLTSGNAYLPGYRLVMLNAPSGATYKGPPSCSYICKANGPEGSIIERGNLVLETPYEAGTLSLMLVDPQGRQASDVFQLVTNQQMDQWWFYYHFGQ